MGKPHTIPVGTTIYGDFLGLSKNNTEGRIVLATGEILSFLVTENQATELSKRKGKTVGLIGSANYNPVTLKIESFILAEIGPYRGGSVAKAFEELRKISTGWDDCKTNDDILRALGRID